MIEKTSFTKVTPVLHDIKRESHNRYRGKELADSRKLKYLYGVEKDSKERVGQVGVNHHVRMSPHCISANNSTWQNGYSRYKVGIKNE